MPAKDREIQKLEERCREGIPLRYPKALRPQVLSRLERELAIIDRLGQAKDFLLLGNVFQFAETESIPCKLIGAGCGSMVCYLLGVTDAEPLRHQLVFERFRGQEGRRSTPFCVRVDGSQKNRLFQFAGSFCTKEKLEEVLTLSEMDAAGRLPYQVAGLIRHRMDATFTLHRIPSDNNRAYLVLGGQERQGIYQVEQDGLGNLFRQFPPAGIGDIAALTALYLATIEHPELEDQFAGGTVLLQYPEAIRSDVAQLLDDTRGLILYEEQIMLLSHWFADVGLSEGYEVTRSATVGRSERMAEFRLCFVANAARNGLEERVAGQLFDEIEVAAKYACCKCHAIAEAVTTYQAAYLKAHFPEEFQEVLESTTTGK